MSDIITKEQAARLIQDDDTICIGGGGAGHAVPDEILKALDQSYRDTGKSYCITSLWNR